VSEAEVIMTGHRPSWRSPAESARHDRRDLRDEEHRTTKENMMGKSASAEKKLNKESKENGSSVDQQILATLQEILSSLRAIESHLPVDTGTMEQRLDDILRELHRHRPARS
jgi:F0F1-type ATP synthase membrane subunit b/b'